MMSLWKYVCFGIAHGRVEWTFCSWWSYVQRYQHLSHVPYLCVCPLTSGRGGVVAYLFTLPQCPLKEGATYRGLEVSVCVRMCVCVRTYVHVKCVCLYLCLRVCGCVFASACVHDCMFFVNVSTMPGVRQVASWVASDTSILPMTGPVSIYCLGLPLGFSVQASDSWRIS